jgi:hypothetical protein
MYVWWGRSKKKGRGIREWWGKKRKKKKKEKKCDTWVVKKKKKKEKGGGRGGEYTMAIEGEGGGKWERKVF